MAVGSSNDFDLVVLGAGTGGYAAAFRAAQLGLKVALVDEDKIGGTCLHRGCIPTKALLESAAFADRVRHAADYGLTLPGDPVVDYAAMAARRDAVVKRMWTGLKTLIDKNKVTWIAGRGKLDGPGKGGSAHYVQPEERTVDLPAGALFPTAHSLALLAEAEAGTPFFFSDVFDGSDEDGLFGVGAIIGKRIPPEKGGDDRAPLLTEAPSWRLRLAFFPHANPAPEPEHEQIFRLHGNGIAEELVLDYGDFSVRAALGKVEKLPTPGC